MSILPNTGPVNQAVVDRFREHRARWRDQHPGWTEARQLAAFSPMRLWERAHGHGPTYRALMVAAGYLIPVSSPGSGPRSVREFFGCDQGREDG